MKANSADILIVVTMYMEEKEDLQRTLKGIFRNLKDFEKINVLNHRIGVIVLCDGRKKVHSSIFEWGQQKNSESNCNNYYSELLMKEF